jgi:3-oxoadipate enol-lactonase
MNTYFEAQFLPGRPTVIFGSSLGADGRMWAPQVSAMAAHWNTITVDMRGHGRTPLGEAPITIERLADDVIAVADRLGVATFAFCGLSIGGVIGQSLGARYPKRVTSLVLAATGLTIMTPAMLQDRAQRVLSDGMAWIADASESRWFTEAYRQASPGAVKEKMDAMRAMDPRGYAYTCRALGEFDGAAGAACIQAPTLVISGADDIATPPSSGRALAGAIGGARYAELPQASHLCNLEQPLRFNTLLQEHLQQTL